METNPDIYKFMHLFIKSDIIIINRDFWTGPYFRTGPCTVRIVLKMERKIHGIFAYLILRFSTYIMFV